MWRVVSALEELIKKVLKDRRGKDYLENAYRKLYDNAKDITQELENEIRKGRLEKESLDEKAVNAFIQYYAIDHGTSGREVAPERGRRIETKGIVD
jgi:hypothetical protein